MVQEPAFLTLALAEVRMAWVEVGVVMAVVHTFGAIGGFDEEVGEDGDGGFALDHGLDGGEFFEQVLTGDGDLHNSPCCGATVAISRFLRFPALA